MMLVALPPSSTLNRGLDTVDHRPVAECLGGRELGQEPFHRVFGAARDDFQRVVANRECGRIEHIVLVKPELDFVFIALFHRRGQQKTHRLPSPTAEGDPAFGTGYGSGDRQLIAELVVPSGDHPAVDVDGFLVRLLFELLIVWAAAADAAAAALGKPAPTLQLGKAAVANSARFMVSLLSSVVYPVPKGTMGWLLSQPVAPSIQSTAELWQSATIW